MSPTSPYPAGPQERRWPVVLIVLGVVLLLAALPARVRMMPPWSQHLVGAIMLTPLLGVAFTRGRAPVWLRLERGVTLAFCAVATVMVIAMVAVVIRAIVSGDARATGLPLLSSGCAAWVLNVATFGLLHWQLDAGGPGARADGKPDFCDWQFPQVEAPHLVRPNWQPKFVDYLALSFTTATAFSPTDVLPLTHRAKTLMMLQSIISLVTIAVVASRAINVLGQ